jgi:hypothetical protein
MEKWLDIGGTVSAFIAAIFWFLSASGKLPPMVTYWGSTADADPILLGGEVLC